MRDRRPDAVAAYAVAVRPRAAWSVRAAIDVRHKPTHTLTRARALVQTRGLTLVCVPATETPVNADSSGNRFARPRLRFLHLLAFQTTGSCGMLRRLVCTS
eukprot:4462947-Pleurochrysis_carterae.AAC.4